MEPSEEKTEPKKNWSRYKGWLLLAGAFFLSLSIVLVWRRSLSPDSRPHILISRDGRLAALRPDGSKITYLTVPMRPPYAPKFARFSPDGQRIAYLLREISHDDRILVKLRLRSLNETGAGAGLDLESGQDYDALMWGPDGKQLLVGGMERSKEPTVLVLRWKAWLIDVQTGNKTPFELTGKDTSPERIRVADWSPDGQWFLIRDFSQEGRVSFRLVKKDGCQTRRVGSEDQAAVDGRFSPDGRRILYAVAFSRTPGLSRYQLFVVSVEGGEPKAVSPDVKWLMGFCWSPDGKQIAYAWGERDKDLSGEGLITVADADGGNATTLIQDKSESVPPVELQVWDWR